MITTLFNKIQGYLSEKKPIKDFLEYKHARMDIEGLEGSVLTAFLGLLQLNHSDSHVWAIYPTEDSVHNAVKDAQNAGIEFIYLPSSGRVLYSEESSIDSRFEQIRALASIIENPQALILTHLRAFASPVYPKDNLSASTKTFSIGDHCNFLQLAEELIASGYVRVPRTTLPGEFSIRGEVFDIFPFEDEIPFRLFSAWDEIEKIAHFDPIVQESKNPQNSITFHVVTDEKDPSETHISAYFGKRDCMVFCGKERLEASFASLLSEAKALYREHVYKNPELIKPKDLLFNYPESVETCSRSIRISDLKGQNKEAFSLPLNGPRSYFGNFNYFRDELDAMLYAGNEVWIFAGSSQQTQRLKSMLPENKVRIADTPLSDGFSLPELHIVAICEHEIFGRRKKVVKTLHHTQSSPLDSFVDLNPGDYVVHINYGVGQFKKIDRIKAAGKERDYIKIEYAQEEFVFIPIEQANLIQRYIGSEGRPPKLDKIGGTSWETKKQKARKSAEDLAEHLIHLYARRKQSQGFPFPKDTDWQLQFEASFPFDETEDQLAVVADIKQDMESPCVMDRLVCGDVGYGKTEVAIRAIFKAVMSGKQAALLAPTTILAEQHYETLLERLGDYPVKVALLSRMVTPKVQKKILQKTAAGEIDILVGTHRIIQKDIVYKDLGLLVVDEEQRFGVKDKEKIKVMKTSVDCLALSATPIPRTLYMSLLKIRDMSLLTTPPIQRRPIKTCIQEFDIAVIEEAVHREINRGGQVFFLHNRINTLDKVVTMLQKLLPDVSIDFAHGQMTGDQLEEKMRNFIHGRVQLLVATTIIENGIDIPNVNTIIIDRADIYGVSQLYQLRGRVGRSDKEAYAYLLYPMNYALSEIAMKRLKVLSEHTELGAGFKIAMKDMEIRGTGNLLGREQHGQMASVGLDMYLRILDEEIAKLRKDDKEEDWEVFLDLDYSGYIPDDYITDPGIKFDIYKKIASIHSNNQLQALTAELDDRFGDIPESVANLLYIAELKVLCKRMHIQSLRERNGVVRIEFIRVATISIDKVLHLIRESGGAVSIDHAHPNIMTMKTEAVSLKDKSLFILEKLQRLL